MAKLIGTAGHVDHGKTTLIKALTGIDADRLPEEKKRGMTIDIGFAYVDLPNHGRVSIVDVPGHERFISNMLVGALGIDVALLCVAADEAVKPQTREHLQILELLPVDKLVVALTRADLADAETRELARLDVEELVSTSRFKEAPTVEVSAVTGEGLAQLKVLLTEALDKAPADSGKGPWYLPIDRVFTVKGHGCVVTGTLAQGQVRKGEKAYLEPGHWEVRVRGIESHGAERETAEKGSRTALNLSGAKAEDVHRGMALGAPGALFETEVFDGKAHWTGPVKHAMRVRVSIGAEEAIGRAFLDREDPQNVQIRLESRVAAALGQPFIVRRYSPPDLLGGGRVLVPQAKPWRRKEKPIEVQVADTPDAILQILAVSPEGVPTEEICRRLGQTPQALGPTFEALLQERKTMGFAGLWFSADSFAETSRRFLEGLSKAHSKMPTKATVPREAALQESGLPWSGKPLDRILAHLASTGALQAFGTNVRLPGFQVQLPSRQRELLDRVKSELEKESINVPTGPDLSAKLGVPPQAIAEIVRLGQQAGELLVLGELAYTPSQIERLKVDIRRLSAGKPFAAAQMRDALGTSRKYIIPVLEYLDSIRFTTRIGENRMVN